MAKYKLTVKYSGVCELSIAGDIPDIIKSEFDQYVKSILYKKEEWENFETNFKEAAKLEYGEPKKLEDLAEDATKEALEEILENGNQTAENIENNENSEDKQDDKPVEENDTACSENDAENNDNTENAKEINQIESEKIEKTPQKTEKKAKKSRMELVSFGEYIKGKNIKTPLDEFVAGGCYLDEILNVKEFSLKQINAKLYPAFKRLASSIVIEEAQDRVLIETIKEDDKVRYKINQNAWNYHNFDLVGQSTD